MRKFYDKDEVWFAVFWIILYCVVIGSVRGSFGDESPVNLGALALIAAAITLFVRSNRLEAKYGLDRWPADWKRFLYFIPMWVLATGNLWGGIRPQNSGAPQLFAILSMALVGYVEELIFRGFLFRGLLKAHGPKTAVIVSAATFGMGHIINLLTGHGGSETAVQILFAVSLGFVFTLVVYKSGSLLPVILAHSLIDVFSRFAVDDPRLSWIYMITTIVVSVLYCAYLLKLPPAAEKVS